MIQQYNTFTSTTQHIHTSTIVTSKLGSKLFFSITSKLGIGNVEGIQMESLTYTHLKYDYLKYDLSLFVRRQEIQKVENNKTKKR